MGFDNYEKRVTELSSPCTIVKSFEQIVRETAELRYRTSLTFKPALWIGTKSSKKQAALNIHTFR